MLLKEHSYRDAQGGLGIAQTSAGFDVARELHDNVEQQLTSVSMLLGKLGNHLHTKDISYAEDLQCIEEQLLRVTRDVRGLSRGVKASCITAVRFNDAVRRLAKDVRRATRLHTIMTLTDSLLPNDVISEQLFRIVQEAVHNVVRHARASSLRIHLKKEDHAFVLVVRDDGNGIPAGKRAPAGGGVDGMASRAGVIGARLEVRSIPGRGTAVRCVVPF
jgi:signal transduction histidine kinase